MYTDPDGLFFGWDDALFAVISFAAAEGAKAAAINVTVQLIQNNGLVSKVNWTNVGQSFLSAGMTAGLGVGGGIFKPGGSDIFSYAASNGLNGGINNVAVNWALGNGGNAWGQFSQGFQTGAAAGVAKWGYKEIVGYRPRMESGKGVIGEDGISDRGPKEAAREWYNVIGNPVNKITNPDNFVNNVFPGREGGPISNIINFLPGANSFAQVHDWMCRQWGIEGSYKDSWSLGLMAPSYFLNTGALATEFSGYYR